MKSAHRPHTNSKTYLSRPVLAVTILLLAIAAMVFVIRQTEMFQLRPATGTAKAISEASAPPAAETARR